MTYSVYEETGRSLPFDMTIHEARVRLASTIANDALSHWLEFYAYGRLTDFEQIGAYDYVLSSVKAFIDSGDIKDIEIEQHVEYPNDILSNINFTFELKVIPIDYVHINFSTKIADEGIK